MVTEMWVGERMYYMGLKQHPIMVVLIVMDFQVPCGKDFRKMFSYFKVYHPRCVFIYAGG